MDLEEKVVTFLRMKNAMLAEIGVYSLCKTKEMASNVAVRQDLILKRLQLIENWLLLLDSDETFIVEHHLIDGMSWPTLTSEYKKRWPDAPKAERTLVRKQAGAVGKIVAFTKGYFNILEYLLLDFPTR